MKARWRFRAISFSPFTISASRKPSTVSFSLFDSLADRFCCYFLNLLYNGSSLIDSELDIQDIVISFRNENISDDFSYRREDRRRDKRMNWSIAINDTNCRFWLQYTQYQGGSSLIPLPSVFLTVFPTIFVNIRFEDFPRGMRAIRVLRCVC